MALDIIGPGFGRTGTGTLKRALEELGLGPCHHSFGHPGQLPYWRAAIAGRAVDWDKLFAGYRAQLDWPGAHYWRELTATYPRAKVILTTRPEEEWWRSFSATIAVVLSRHREMNLQPHVRELIEIGAEIVGPQTIGSSLFDRDAALAAYRRHNRQVMETIAPDRLLIYNVSEGWAPLCKFLGREAPDKPFPHINATEDWWSNWPTRLPR
jgi:hypothetical protein